MKLNDLAKYSMTRSVALSLSLSATAELLVSKLYYWKLFMRFVHCLVVGWMVVHDCVARFRGIQQPFTRCINHKEHCCMFIFLFLIQIIYWCRMSLSYLLSSAFSSGNLQLISVFVSRVVYRVVGKWKAIAMMLFHPFHHNSLILFSPLLSPSLPV